MKATGIVRRIDDLGRIVIPKEIRRNLNIREGAPLEIFVDPTGELVLKKYSPMKELADFAQDYVESLHAKTQLPSIVVDHDGVVAVSDTDATQWLRQEVPEQAMQCMEERRAKLFSGDDAVWGFVGCVIAPVIAEGDPIGAVIVGSKENELGELEFKLAETAAGFLGKQIEP